MRSFSWTQGRLRPSAERALCAANLKNLVCGIQAAKQLGSDDGPEVIPGPPAKAGAASKELETKSGLTLAKMRDRKFYFMIVSVLSGVSPVIVSRCKIFVCFLLFSSTEDHSAAWLVPR
jgi:hypothetical protein